MTDKSGSAFPVTIIGDILSTGMTERKLFAGLAMIGMWANPCTPADERIIASRAFKQADALLAAARESSPIVDQPVSRIEYDRQLAHALALESKLSACERERDQLAIDVRELEKRNARLAANLRGVRQEKYICERERETDGIVIAALKRRLEPLTNSDTEEMSAVWHIDCITIKAMSAQIDTIRARRA